MEKPILHLPSISVLILMLCASLSAMGQDMNRPALCLDAPDVAVTSPAVVQLRASAAPAPMLPRPGDVNADGHITIADVTDLIDILLSGSAAYSANADADNDGLVTIGDVTTLIDMLLTGSDATAYNYGKASDNYGSSWKNFDDKDAMVHGSIAMLAGGLGLGIAGTAVAIVSYVKEMKLEYISESENNAQAAEPVAVKFDVAPNSIVFGMTF